MAGMVSEIERAVAALAADPALAVFASPQAAVLAWDTSADRILWASQAAIPLRYALADPDGRIDPALPALDRLKKLGSGLAPIRRTRIERLRLDPAQLSPPVACACCILDLASGTRILLTAIAGPVPRTGITRRRAAPESGGHKAEAGSEPVQRPTPPHTGNRRGTVRFVWQADRDGRFTQVSPDLAEVVGPMAADIVGRTWEEVAQTLSEDEPGAIAALLANRTTWSGRTVYWPIDNTCREIPVELAGLAVFGRNKELVGFRGFGLCRSDAIRDRAEPDTALEVPPVVSGFETTPAGISHFSADEPAAGELAMGDDPSEPDQETATIEADPTPAEPAPTEPALREPAPTEPEPTEIDGEDPGKNWFEGIREHVAARLASKAASADGESGEDHDGQTDSSAKAEPTKTVDTPRLSGAERSAFREIARALGARFDDEEHSEAPPSRNLQPSGPANGDRVLERLPAGVLVHRGERILFANRLLLDLVEYEDINQIMADGGVVHLFRGSPSLLRSDEGGSPLALSTRYGVNIAVEVRLSTVEWDGLPANLMLIRKVPEADPTQRLRAAELDLRLREARIRELESVLDTATDGVIVLDETGRILSLNRSAEALFGYDQREVVGDAITVLLAPESHMVALDYLEGLRSSSVASLLNDGREVIGRVRQGGAIPLFMTMGHISEGPERKLCAVLRDMTAFKKAESELLAAKRAAEEASAQKSDLLAKISHEIRTPLNAIIGFAEVILEERFGPIGNERYKDYLKDVHASGAHVISLVNDLLDLAKIEAGHMELAFTSVKLNELVGACVTLLQPQAARERIVMRTSFASKLPPVVADERSIRQIVLNLVSNAIQFTDAGGQVIVSTAMTDRGEVAFRVRDTGIGMTEQEIVAALEPFRQLATARKGGGTGLGLPLTKALVEANRGALQITSAPNDGTLVEVIFPPTRVLAE